MDFRTYLDNLPPLHSWDGGKTWNEGGFYKEALEALGGFLSRQERPRRIIETGAGNSTLFFLFHEPERLVSIAPDEALFERITAFADRSGIDRRPLQIWATGSQWALPEITKGSATFDFALIDGFHGWPLVMTDFYYMNHMVEAGGHIMIDDINLYSIKELCRWLKEQPGFELAFTYGKFAIFKKLWAGDAVDFGGQPYILRKTEEERAEAYSF